MAGRGFRLRPLGVYGLYSKVAHRSSNLYATSVAVPMGLCLAWSETSNTCFLVDQLGNLPSVPASVTPISESSEHIRRDKVQIISSEWLTRNKRQFKLFIAC